MEDLVIQRSNISEQPRFFQGGRASLGANLISLQRLTSQFMSVRRRKANQLKLSGDRDDAYLADLRRPKSQASSVLWQAIAALLLLALVTASLLLIVHRAMSLRH